MIKIFTFASHRPDFIGLQFRSFQRYLRDEYSFTVFNNARLDNSGPGHHGAIRAACEGYGAPCIDIERDRNLEDRCQALEKVCTLFDTQGRYSNANVACAYPLCWAWENFIAKESCPVAIMHSDVFLTRPICLTDCVQDISLRYIPWTVDNIEYMWEAFCLVNLKTLPQPETVNWYCGQIKNVSVDVGGQTHHYLRAHPGIGQKIKMDRFEDYDEFSLDETPCILHYRSGSNWNLKSSDYHRLKTEWLRQKIG